MYMGGRAPDGKGAVSPISTTFKERLIPGGQIIMLRILIIKLVILLI